MRSKKKDDKFMLDLLYFVSVLTIAALLLSYIFVLSPESDFGTASVASQTGSMLRTIGVPADVVVNFIVIGDMQVEIVPECVG